MSQPTLSTCNKPAITEYLGRTGLASCAQLPAKKEVEDNQPRGGQ